MADDRPNKECRRAGCIQLTKHSSGHCQQHRTEQRQQQLSQADIRRRRMYGRKAWRQLREIKLNNNPICEWEGCELPAEDVHHLKDVRDRPDLALTYNNLQALCKPHHSKITGIEANQRN